MERENYNTNFKSPSMDETALWKEIGRLDWFNASLSSNRNEIIKDKLMDMYNLDTIYLLKNFAVQERITMAKVISLYIGQHLPEDENWDMMNMPYVYTVSDDSLWDLAAHIVGLGEVMYYKILLNPQLLETFKENEIKENFEYGFDAAIYELRNAQLEREAEMRKEKALDAQKNQTNNIEENPN